MISVFEVLISIETKKITNYVESVLISCFDLEQPGIFVIFVNTCLDLNWKTWWLLEDILSKNSIKQVCLSYTNALLPVHLIGLSSSFRKIGTND